MPAHKDSDIPSAERRIQAMELRARGLSFRQIGEQIGVTKARAHEYVRRGLELARAELKELAESYIALELERLEMPVLELTRLIFDRNLPAADRLAAIDTWRKLSESRRKLLGLDAAKEVNLRAAVLDWDALAAQVPADVPDAVEAKMILMLEGDDGPERDGVDDVGEPGAGGTV